jgi:hypothetical protein
MREIIASGGLMDTATLHPLGSLIVLTVAALLVRAAMRGLALQRRGRLQRPPEAL